MNDLEVIEGWMENSRYLKINSASWPPLLHLDLPKIRNRANAEAEKTTLLELLFSNNNSATFSTQAESENRLFINVEKEAFDNKTADLRLYGDWFLCFPALSSELERQLRRPAVSVLEEFKKNGLGTMVLSHPDDIEWSVLALPFP